MDGQTRSEERGWCLQSHLTRLLSSGSGPASILPMSDGSVIVVLYPRETEVHHTTPITCSASWSYVEALTFSNISIRVDQSSGCPDANTFPSEKRS